MARLSHPPVPITGLACRDNFSQKDLLPGGDHSPNPPLVSDRPNLFFSLAALANLVARGCFRKFPLFPRHRAAPASNPPDV